MSEEHAERPLSERVFENNLVTLPWIAFLVALTFFVGMPFARALVVCWVKGTDAYFRLSIRIPKSKHPLHFTDGTTVPELTYALANIAVFMLIAGGLSFSLIYCLRFYERHFRK